MKKLVFAFTMIFCSLTALVAAIQTLPASRTINVGDSLGYRFSCNDGNHVNIYFGDGDALLNVVALTDMYSYHRYKNPGTYTFHKHVTAAVVTPSCLVDEYATITVLENRSIIASPVAPIVNQTITFTGVNFKTPTAMAWDLGDGTFLYRQTNVISHAYSQAGDYTIKAYDWGGGTANTPVILLIHVTLPVRAINYSPESPRVDQPIDMQAVNFRSASITWNFGDGTPEQVYSAAVSHRYQNPGAFTISAKEFGMDTTAVNREIVILPENRSLVLSAQEIRTNEFLTVTAVNFRGRLVLWDFGDGTEFVSGPAVMTHSYEQAGEFIITARDENGISEKKFQAAVRILGINDQVNLEVAEIALDNGKYYKVVPKNSKNIKAELKMKMRGTGIVSGYWIVDNQPYEFFNETVYQGQIKNIYTREIPGLPVSDPGMHTITVQLTRPATEAVFFPTLRYFVLPYKDIVVILAPRDGAIIKEDETTNFAWQEVEGGSYYQIAFANSLYPLLQNDPALKWLDCPDRLSFLPEAETWNAIKRNQWTYWKVRAMDSAKSVLAESNIQEMKIIIPGAKVGIEKITDMDGNGIAFGGSLALTKVDPLMVQGYLIYPAEAEFLILRIYANNNLIDQLLFRDVKKDEKLQFETSVPNTEKESRLAFQVLKSSSPSVIIGQAELQLKKE